MFIVLIRFMHFSCFGKKSAKRSRLKEALRANRALLKNPPAASPENVSKSDIYNPKPLKIFPKREPGGRLWRGSWPADSASPMPLSLVTFLCGHKKVTPIVRTTN